MTVLRVLLVVVLAVCTAVYLAATVPLLPLWALLPALALWTWLVLGRLFRVRSSGGIAGQHREASRVDV